MDDVARATQKVEERGKEAGGWGQGLVQALVPQAQGGQGTELPARQVIIQRRSALGFDAASSLTRPRFISMLRRLKPGAPPWDAIDWSPQVHLVLFVHRVDDLHPGLYLYLRDAGVLNELRAAMRPDFLWEPVNDSNDPNDLCSC